MDSLKAAIRTSEDPWIEGRLSLSVYYEDTDFSGYVYHANYLKFFERGREELIGTGFLRSMFERGFHFVVGRAEISYHRPARHADRLEIVTRMRLSSSQVTLVEHVAYRQAPEGGAASEKLVTALVKLIGVDASGEMARMPPDVQEHFRNLR